MNAPICPSSATSASRLWQLTRVLALTCAIIIIAGCGRSRDDAADEVEVEPVYELTHYEIAETSVKRQIRDRLAAEEIEMRDFWLGLRPVAGGPPELNADVDVYARTDETEEVSNLVAEIALEALPRHDSVQVRVYWWGREAGDSYAHLAGLWTWNAQGELLGYTSPEDVTRVR